MTMTDPIADYLTRLRNALKAKHKRVDIPVSGMKRELTKLLVEQKFLGGYTEHKDGPQGTLRIQLKYHDAQPVIRGLKRISTPGLRVYKAADEMPRVLGGLGIAVVSTSKGLMTEKQAREAGVGGEVLCEIW
jgi:small subunit ribosomal protein S8